MGTRSKAFKIARVAAIGVTALGAIVGGTGAANASTPTSDYVYESGVQVMLRPVNGTTTLTVCNDSSTGLFIDVGMWNESNDGVNVPMKDPNDGWITKETQINFNPGGCESFFIYGDYVPGDVIRGEAMFYPPGGAWNGTFLYAYVSAV